MMMMDNEIKIIENPSVERFDLLVKEDVPFIIRRADFGPCLKYWCNNEYFLDKISKDKNKQVSVHVAQEPLLNFIEKNFTYHLMDFHQFLKLCSNDDNDGKYYYLRSIGDKKKIANINEQFPEIVNDVQYPEFMNFCQQENCCTNCDKRHLFSSIVRISSKNLSIWTHYDVMENILVQINGRKKVQLFPPMDAPFLYLMGDKSIIMDWEADDLYDKYPLLINAHKYQCILQPGDSLFIPSMWFHNTRALDYSIGLNFFWKNAQLLHQYDQNDIYGNKDLKQAMNAYMNLNKAIQHLNKLPDKYRKFYISMMISKLNESLLK